MNLSLFYFLNNLAGKSVWFDAFAIFVTNYVWVVAFGIIVVLYLRRGYLHTLWSKNLLLLVTPVVAMGVTYVLKHLVNSPRPVQVISDVVNLVNKNGFDSFPSNHTTFMTALAVAAFYFGRKAGYFITALAVLVAISRIVVGAHFPVDVLGGIVVGLSVGFIGRFAMGRIKDTELEKRPENV